MKPAWKQMLALSALCFTSAFAQSAGGLRQKYGAPDAKGQYVIRPGVVMSVTFNEDKQAREFLIKPQASAAGKETGDIIPERTITWIIDELAPAGQRGKHLRSMVFNAGCASTATDEYEQVRISRALTCASGGGVTSARVCWKSRGCK
jgi:hypothetical protein